MKKESKKIFWKFVYIIVDFFLTKNSIPLFGYISKKMRCFFARRISKGIDKKATIEKGARIDVNVYCDKRGCIGIKCITCSGLHIGENTMMGPNCVFYSINHKRALEGKKVFVGTDKPKDIYIGKECWVGSNCIVLGGVNIGEGSTIAAGSVVSHDVPPFSLAAGNPAVIKKTYIPPKGYYE